MTDLRLERDFRVAPQVLFDWISRTENLLKWWGPEGLHVPEHDLDLSRPGPWYSVMVNGDGQRFKVSGQVTHVNPPVSVGFTWAWHDDDNQRGHESHVTFTVTETAEGARLIVDHRDLDGGEMGARHEEGWTSALRKLTAQLEH